ncbi:hypothetical protein D4764_12G0002950 [Takifugu flavidus]|uniref:Uncharacterized protein n=1 Tax=Takifugu flavidus TaxID=433684 RepID=A0A5C6PBZ3_9TELE|nr:hypothetical protein D4764_12G0002950 [Takifugu flavidus]
MSVVTMHLKPPLESKLRSLCQCLMEHTRHQQSGYSLLQLEAAQPLASSPELFLLWTPPFDCKSEPHGKQKNLLCSRLCDGTSGKSDSLWATNQHKSNATNAVAEKPLPQGPPGGVIGVLGGVVAIGLIAGVAVTVFMVHRRQQKTRTETDNDLTDLPPAHKPAPPPPKKKNSDMKGHLTSDDIQVVHLDKDEEMQKLPLQPPYYDMAPSESTPFTDKPLYVLTASSIPPTVLRTQATRTVMSSMRSWILQLWPPLPAHEAPLTLARGILSSMQPSSLAHTSACHYRPFPSDFGLKDSGRRPEELNPAEIMCYPRVCNTEPFPEPQPAPAYPPVTFLPQNPYQQHPTNEPTYSNTGFPAPGPRAPFSFPKEQSV